MKLTSHGSNHWSDHTKISNLSLGNIQTKQKMFQMKAASKYLKLKISATTRWIITKFEN